MSKAKPSLPDRFVPKLFTMEQKQPHQPTAAFIGASWTALIIGISAFIIGLWNAEMELNEKGYYFTVLMFGLFASSLFKNR
jgi:uncharacterized membrane protein YiaA